MKFLVISDIHGNWNALQSVLTSAEGEYEQMVCCGDLVGYNARPNLIVDWIREHCALVIRGNHDKVVAGNENLEWFNEVAQTAALWTMGALDDEQLQYLRQLPQGPASLQGFQFWHGSPRDEDEYVSNITDATGNFAFFDEPLGFFGHTHLQGGFFRTGGKTGTIQGPRQLDHERVLELHPDLTYMVNPGSVGQPRDGDPRAAYAIYDSNERTVALRRIKYDITATAREIRAAGLPDVLALRLFQGL